MKKTSNKHEFAFFCDTLPEATNSTFLVTDQELVHHMKEVVRSEVGTTCILFNRDKYAHATVTSMNKKDIVLHIDEIVHIRKLRPHLAVIMPLLKRDTLKEATYYATACGVNELILCSTEKSRTELFEHEYEKLEKVAIAAAQQAKQFALPDIHKPTALTTLLNQMNDYTIVGCEPEGQPLQVTINQLRESTKKIALLVGPEGDFTHQEKLLLKPHIVATRLTQTVLRSEDALLVAVGAIRSLL